MVTYCEKDSDNIFCSSFAISLMTSSFERGVNASHPFSSGVPAASSMMMYSEPTELSSTALHAYTRGTGISNTVRAYHSILVFRC